MTLALERAHPTPFSSSSLLPLLLLSLAKQRHTPDGSKRIKREYDYVIVGGGTAGSVVASRLSEKPCVNVLLLEAGHKPPLLTEVPALARYFRFTGVDWKHRTVPQKHTGKALVNRQVPWSSGKMLGGSSSLNNMIYVRGNRKNYDEWEGEGAKGWSYKDVFPYFLKLENNKDYEFLKNGYHTRGGPVTVHQPRYDSELKRAVYKAAEDLGYKIVDSNAARQTGFYEHQGFLKGSQRCSTAKAYLVPAENRTNLDILPNALATKIIIKGRKARGVRFEFRGHSYVVRVRKEVIVSAGTVNTAQLLMLSGIGPERELEKLNIPVVADLPVGQNLQDHAQVPFPYVLTSYIPSFIEKISDPKNIRQYTHNRTGPLASTTGIEFVAFLKEKSTQPHVDFPNYELEFAEATTSTAKYLFGLKPEVYRKLYGSYEKEPLFMCQVSQLQPKSRGSVTLRSKNPYVRPNVDPNYLADPRDIEDLVQGMKTCEKIASNRYLQKLGARPFKTLVPGCEKYAYDDDDYFRCYAKSILVTSHDPVGTAKMGDPWDSSTVVDPKLRVKKIKRLRVVDASIMPKIPSGHTSAPTIMIAEKASDIIKETINCYKNWDEPEKSTQWSGEEDDDDEEEEWKDKEHWEKPEDEEVILVETDDYWEKPKEPTWEDDEEKWEKPKDEHLWEDYEWETEPEKGKWEKPKDTGTVWIQEDKWEKPEQDKWEKPKDTDTIWIQEDKWKKPEETDSVYIPKDQWKKPEDDYKKQWEKSKELEEQWENPKDKITIVLKDEYMPTEIPKYGWDVTHKNSWPKDEKKLIDYFKPPIQVPNSEIKSDYENVYRETPQTWTHNGKHQSKDGATGHLPVFENVKSTDGTTTLPYSWYKQQTDSHLKKYKELTGSDSKGGKTESNTHWEEPDEYETSKDEKESGKFAEWKDDVGKKPSEAWKASGDYRETKSIEELVKLAERDAKSTTTTNSPWQESDSYDMTKSLEELLELADEPPYPSTEHTATSPKTRWY